MDPVVTARVPAEVRDQGNAILRQLGATPTELVNAAYEYLLNEKRLPPVAHGAEELPGGVRALSPEDAAKVLESLDSMALEVPESWHGASMDELAEPIVQTDWDYLE